MSDELPTGVKSVTAQGCGCRNMEYHDGRVESEPCFAHALYWAGDLLRRAAEAVWRARERRP